MKEETLKIVTVQGVVKELCKTKEILYMAHKNNISSSRKINEKFLTLKERIDDFINEILSEEALKDKPKVTCRNCKFCVKDDVYEGMMKCHRFVRNDYLVSDILYVNDWNFCSWGEPVEKKEEQ